MFAKQNTHLKITAYGLILLVCYLLQSVPAFSVRFLGTAPELVLVLCICVAFNENETFSMLFGLAAGLLSDVVTDNIVGKSALFFMFAAFFVSVLLQTLLRKMFLSYIFTTLSLILIYLLLEYFSVLLFVGPTSFGTSVVKIILPKFFFTGVLAYPLYFVVDKIAKLLERYGESGK